MITHQHRSLSGIDPSMLSYSIAVSNLKQVTCFNKSHKLRDLKTSHSILFLFLLSSPSHWCWHHAGACGTLGNMGNVCPNNLVPKAITSGLFVLLYS
jgi:hypothetical protein